MDVRVHTRSPTSAQNRDQPLPRSLILHPPWQKPLHTPSTTVALFVVLAFGGSTTLQPYKTLPISPRCSCLIYPYRSFHRLIPNHITYARCDVQLRKPRCRPSDPTPRLLHPPSSKLSSHEVSRIVSHRRSPCGVIRLRSCHRSGQYQARPRLFRPELQLPAASSSVGTQMPPQMRK